MITELRKVNQGITNLKSRFFERDNEIRGLFLATLARVHILLLGPPGTAKSQIVINFHKLIKESKYFQWLLTKYTTPDELFGPFSLAQLENDRYVRKTANKAPEAHFIFFDEIWKANSGVLNANLTLINERLFYNGDKPEPVPLLTLVGASNELPEEDDNLDAMLDRFILKYHVKPIVEEQNFMNMLNTSEEDFAPVLSLEDITKLQSFVRTVRFPQEMLELYATLRRDFAKEGLPSSDRTYRNTVEVLKAEAVLRYTENFITNGGTNKEFDANDIEVIEDDFEILKHALWSDPNNESTIYTIILSEVNPDKQKVVELIEDAQNLYDDLLAEKDKTKQIKDASETAIKLREVKKKIYQFKKSMDEKKKDTTDIKNMADKIDAMLDHIFGRICNYKF